MNETIQKFLDDDGERLAEMVLQYPKQIPIPVLAEFLGCSPDSLRMSLTTKSDIGFSWQKFGKQNRGFCIPTGLFIRWYMKV